MKNKSGIKWGKVVEIGSTPPASGVSVVSNDVHGGIPAYHRPQRAADHAVQIQRGPR
jgi:hypothetical protein